METRTMVKLVEDKFVGFLRQKHLNTSREVLGKGKIEPKKTEDGRAIPPYFKECCLRTSTADTTKFLTDKPKAALFARDLVAEYLCKDHKLFLNSKVVAAVVAKLGGTMPKQDQVTATAAVVGGGGIGGGPSAYK